MSRTHREVSVFSGESHSEGGSNGTVQCCVVCHFARPRLRPRIRHLSMILLVLCERVSSFFLLRVEHRLGEFETGSWKGYLDLSGNK